MSEENSIEGARQMAKKPKPRARRSYQKDLADLTGRVNTALVIIEIVGETKPPGCEVLLNKAISVLKGES